MMNCGLRLIFTLTFTMLNVLSVVKQEWREKARKKFNDHIGKALCHNYAYNYG